MKTVYVWTLVGPTTVCKVFILTDSCVLRRSHSSLTSYLRARKAVISASYPHYACPVPRIARPISGSIEWAEKKEALSLPVRMVLDPQPTLGSSGAHAVLNTPPFLKKTLTLALD